MDNNNGHAPELTREQLNALDLVKGLSPEMAQAVRDVYSSRLNSGAGEADQVDPWKAYTLADAYQERPQVEYIAGKLFELPSLNIVYGAPGTLKSFLLQDLAISVAAGQGWLLPAPWNSNPGSGFVTKPAPVMWIDFDNGARRTLNRFESLGRARQLSPETPITFYSMPNPWLYATKPESIGSLTERIKKAGARLVIIDNLGNVSGDADENSADMGAVMSQFRQLAEQTGAALILVHHQRKGNGTPGGRAGDSLRGHSSIEAALDLALLVEREPFSDSITIKATKVRGPEVLPFGAVFTYQTKPGGDELESARFWGLEGQDNQSDTAVKREILAALQGQKLNQTQLVKAVQESLEGEGGKVGKHRIREIAGRLVSEKKIEVTQGQANASVYELV